MLHKLNINNGSNISALPQCGTRRRRRRETRKKQSEVQPGVVKQERGRGQETRRSATNEVWMTCTGCRLIAVKFMGHTGTQGRAAGCQQGQTAACLRFNEFARAHANCSVAITLSGNINQNVVVVILPFYQPPPPASMQHIFTSTHKLRLFSGVEFPLLR